jgi:hypothetical protein
LRIRLAEGPEVPADLFDELLPQAPIEAAARRASGMDRGEVSVRRSACVAKVRLMTPDDKPGTAQGA